MSDTAIRVENLGKPYRISQQERYYAHGTLTDTMYALFCSMAFVLNGRRSAVSGP